MDGHSCRSFFLEPQLTFHRRYEALRACFVEDRPVAEVAAQFGYKPTALQVMIRRFHAQFRRGVAVHSELDGVMHNGGGAQEGIHRWLIIGHSQHGSLSAILTAQGPPCHS